MAKSQTKQATEQSKNIYSGAPEQFQPIVGGLKEQQQQTQGFQTQTGQEAKTGFENMQTTGGYDPNQLTGLRGTAQKFTETGGYDPTQLAKITGGYENFAQTGGYDPAQQAAFINAATSGVGSTYDVLRQQQQRQRAAQGLGMGGGEFAQLAREGTAAQQQADLNANVQLQSIINANKLAGLGGGAAVSADVAGKKLGAFGQQAGLESGVAAGSRAGTAGLEGLFDTSTGQLTTQGNQILQAVNSMFGVQLNANQLMQELSKNPGWFQTLMGDIGTVGGAAAGVVGGLGGFGGRASAASGVPPGLGEG